MEKITEILKQLFILVEEYQPHDNGIDDDEPLLLITYEIYEKGLSSLWEKGAITFQPQNK